MQIKLIAAISANQVIGRNNTLPWYLPNDLKHVKELTTGHAILMGRKNLESIGKALPNRTNYVLTRNPDFTVPDVTVLNSYEDLRDNIVNPTQDLFVFGGTEIYKLLYPYVEEMFITHIHASMDGDTYFPSIDWSGWTLVSSKAGELDEYNSIPHTFCHYKRKENPLAFP